MKKEKNNSGANPFSDLKFSESEVNKKKSRKEKKQAKVTFSEKFIKHVFRKTYKKIYARGAASSVSNAEQSKSLKSRLGIEENEENISDAALVLEGLKKKPTYNKKVKELSDKEPIDDKIPHKSANDRFAKSGHLEDEFISSKSSRKNNDEDEIEENEIEENKTYHKSANDRFAKSGHLEEDDNEQQEKDDDWSEEKEFEKRAVRVKKDGRKK